MLKTCYGLCSLRTGVKIVAVYELICTILFLLSVLIYENINKIYPFHENVDVYFFLQSCIIIIVLLKLFSSVSLMQSTFQNAPYKIFLWIVVASIIYLTVLIVSVKMYIAHKVNYRKFAVVHHPVSAWEYYLLIAFIIMNFVTIIEIHIVTSYYIREKHLEDVEQYTRVQKVISSLKHNKTDVFNIASSSSRPEEQTSIFTSFKGISV